MLLAEDVFREMVGARHADALRRRRRMQLEVLCGIDAVVGASRLDCLKETTVNKLDKLLGLEYTVCRENAAYVRDMSRRHF